MKKTKLTKTEKKLTVELENVTKKLQDTIIEYTNTAYQKRQLEAQVEKLQKEKKDLSESFDCLENEFLRIRLAIGKYDENTVTYDDRFMNKKLYKDSVEAFIGFICGQNAVYRDIVNGKKVETQTIPGTVTK